MEVTMSTIWRAAMLSTQTIGFCVFLMACSSPPQSSAPPASETKAPAPAPAEPAPAQDKQYDLKGKVVSIDKQTKTVSVAGEEVPGFMAATTMAYPVKDETLLTTLSPGDQITAKIMANTSEFWLENVAKAGK
jgi:Cu/Ag efflux protein CusF